MALIWSRFILITVILSALTGVITLQKFKIETLQLERDTAQQSNAEKSALIDALRQQVHAKETAQRALQQEIVQIRQQQLQRETTIKHLYETPLVHHWANTRLPDAMPACASTTPSITPVLMLNACASVTPCLLPSNAPKTNGELNLALEAAEAAWAECAAQVDMIVTCQQRNQQHD